MIDLTEQQRQEVLAPASASKRYAASKALRNIPHLENLAKRPIRMTVSSHEAARRHRHV
jgi:hypothetical protein